MITTNRSEDPPNEMAFGEDISQFTLPDCLQQPYDLWEVKEQALISIRMPISKKLDKKKIQAANAFIIALEMHCPEDVRQCSYF